ncbi:hypothetical protein KC19_9G181600 [Ceratodon purpureus]|uniref:PGG domain-containing protein n=1 Tax=Ceratodon purpureus TaxID=3225 RepID=A0A8T0GWW9_CERPU|nr:hypothetical protein KC19_9G181600 [Ceratodon purpureus]
MDSESILPLKEEAIGLKVESNPGNDVHVEEAGVVQPAAAEAMTIEQRVSNFKKNLYPRWKIRIRTAEEHVIREIAEVLDKTVEQGLLSDFESFERITFNNLGGGTPLHWAVRMEDVATVARILEAGSVDVNAEDEWWRATALHWAVRIGNMDIVKAMVTAHLASGELDLNVRDRWGYNALDLALLSGMSVNIPMLRELLKFRHSPGHDKRYRNEDVWREVEEILNGDASTDVQSRLDLKRKGWYGRLGFYGGTWLHWAVRMDDKALALHILAAGEVDANALDRGKMTALHRALYLGNLDMAKAMITGYTKLGNVDVNVVDDEGLTPLHWAIIQEDKGNTDIVNVLLNCEGIRLAEESKMGNTPLQIAHEKGFKDIQKVLMEKEVVRRYVEDLYRDRQVYVDAANAILVGAALIASVTFASWLQPPLGYGSLGYADVQHNKGMRAFWIFNCLSFYFAIATVVCGARSVLPRNLYFIKRSVEKLRKNLLVTSILLACSVFFVIIAFGIAGCIVLNPIVTFQLYMIIPTSIGGLVCVINLLWLGSSIWEEKNSRVLDEKKNQYRDW